MPWMKSRLAGPSQITAASVTQYTAPAASTYNTGKVVVRRIHLYNADTVMRYVTLSVGIDAAGTRLLDAFGIPAATPYDLWGPISLSAAEIIAANADVTLKVTIEIDGEIETF